MLKWNLVIVSVDNRNWWRHLMLHMLKGTMDWQLLSNHITKLSSLKQHPSFISHFLWDFCFIKLQGFSFLLLTQASKPVSVPNHIHLTNMPAAPSVSRGEASHASILLVIIYWWEASCRPCLHSNKGDHEKRSIKNLDPSFGVERTVWTWIFGIHVRPPYLLRIVWIPYCNNSDK